MPQLADRCPCRVVLVHQHECRQLTSRRAASRVAALAATLPVCTPHPAPAPAVRHGRKSRQPKLCCNIRVGVCVSSSTHTVVYIWPWAAKVRRREKDERRYCASREYLNIARVIARVLRATCSCSHSPQRCRARSRAYPAAAAPSRRPPRSRMGAAPLWQQAEFTGAVGGARHALIDSCIRQRPTMATRI